MLVLHFIQFIAMEGTTRASRFFYPLHILCACILQINRQSISVLFVYIFSEAGQIFIRIVYKILPFVANKI